MKPSRRGMIADATLACGATLVLLFSTDAGRGGLFALWGGLALVIAGAALLWGVPPPRARTRLLAGSAGILVGFGLATSGSGVSSFAAIGGGILLLLGLLALSR